MRVTLKRRPPPEASSSGREIRAESAAERRGINAPLRKTTMWSEADLKSLDRLVEKGYSASEIGRELKRSRCAVIGVIHRHRVKLKAQPMLQGKSNSRLAARQAKVEAIRAELRKGAKTQGEIAAEFGVRQNWVSKLSRAMGPSRKASARQVSDARLKARISKRIKLLKEAGAPPVVGYKPESFAPGYRGQQGRLAITELSDKLCKFPIDMPSGEVRYCGDQAEEDGPYCPHHAARCFTGATSTTIRMGQGMPLKHLNHGGWR